MENQLPKFAKLNVEVKGLSISVFEQSTAGRGLQVIFQRSGPVSVRKSDIDFDSPRLPL